ncbi:MULTISPECIES: copper resistance CopC family protein [Micromonospora]|uniref:CopC domain-containing protein n=1 Tax=Micromonospora yangpuensis TaxID=683228 RepID=A0A1C6UUA8_9ACTN|nr:copper resistance CopC family protein [Micromonospora yangpuensis]GGM24383.1 hypothetical protein GCM10012279_48400 [Micromonospora yangpuensis]SCL57556.1 hypothetical protein GA0070617_3560 [Micromonospora yangpuensis]
MTARRAIALTMLALCLALLVRPLFRVPPGELAAASPADGATLTAPPDAVVLTFRSSPRAGTTHVAVVDGDGRPVSAGPPRTQTTQVQLPVSIDAPGWYRVAYHTDLSDGSRATGSVTFAVGAPEGDLPPQAATPAEDGGHAGHGGPPDPLTMAALAANVVVLLVIAVKLVRTRRSGW